MITSAIIQKSQLEGAHRLDAEYYQPEYLVLRDNLKKTKSVRPWGEIEGKFITGPFGSEFNTENYVQQGEYRYVRGKDVKDFFPTEEDNVYIPKEDYERLKKYSLNEGDIIVSVVGTPGIGAIVDSTLPPAIFSCKSTVYRTKSINPFYFIAYLNSSYGRKLLERSVRGAVQTGLNIDDLRNLPVFLPDSAIQEGVGGVVKNAKKLLDESKLFYFQAENLLLEELGLKDYKARDDLSYVVNLSDVKSAHRIDAEYFQPKYENFFPQLKNQSKLKNIAFVGRGSLIDPRYYSETEGTPYLRGGDFSSGRIERSRLVYINNFESRNETKVSAGDVVFALIGSVGTSALVEKDFNNSFISNNTGKISIKNKQEILPEYLSVVLRSMVGRWQFDRESSQTAQPKISDSQVKNFSIPILSQLTQQKIADLVRQSHEARKKAKELLEEAKRKVEEMIESKK
ncbi:MAG: restriction endonuclease subunit S [Patescibacteria group bacterium]